MPVKIHGRTYLTVAERVTMLHDKHKDVSISTKIYEFHRSESGNEIVIRASVRIGENLFTGFAHERENLVNKQSVNATSFIENAETSAIGRALAAAGLSGSEYASADEINAALKSADSNLAKQNRDLREQLQQAAQTEKALMSQLEKAHKRLENAKFIYREMKAQLEA